MSRVIARNGKDKEVGFTKTRKHFNTLEPYYFYVYDFINKRTPFTSVECVNENRRNVEVIQVS